MSGNGKNRVPLVAERRYPKAANEKVKTSPAPRRAAPARKSRGIVGWILFPFIWTIKLIWRFTWRIGLVTAAITGVAVFYYASQMSPIEDIVDGRVRGSVTLTDREGQAFTVRGESFGGAITANSVSPYLKNAVIASEDKRFYWHPGIDPRGIASAVRINLREGRGPLSGNGGSTLTQQTAKLLCLGTPFDPTQWENEAAYEADCRRGTIWRKVKEAVYAMAMEVAYSKDEILTIYLNRAYLGSGSRGFEAAAQRFFGKSAAELTPAEAAMLSGILPAPSRLAPTNNLERAQGRAGVVIGLMEAQGYITSQQAADAKANPATLTPSATKSTASYFADWVMASGPEFFTNSTTEDVIIRSTLDREIQDHAEAALKHIFETKVSASSEAEAAIVVMSADGAVRAMVGGRSEGFFNRATQARRQTGSAFKPFIYATALELGFSGDDLIDDSPISIEIPGQPPWEPGNYDNQFKGIITLTQALAESRNIPAVVLSEEVGREAVSTVARGFGIESDLATGPALALGVSESTLLEMTGAYAGILNGGSSVTPYGLLDLRIKGDDAPLMTNDGTGIGERVIREAGARELTWMMSRVVESGTGTRARMDGWQIAGKTGTTNSARDAWFIAFTGDYVTGVWMGYDDNRPLTGVTGGGLPADIWRETMSRVTAGQQPTALPATPPQGGSGAGPILDQGIVAPAEIQNVLDNIFNQVNN
ncbi:penicillin-binding protein, 1A family [Cognatiyoonia koreensis]|uniref:peptidoglycan glycosyltransferase n=1 Tax=Cognatiyoonia koreensis TaxID=364200 RepID=A0A1I0REX7_9RHOB|nr:PBP1A family penicillin-binding protein [Cognatiyoonia koreensis]SEW39314.1 penicillin-binding protein, 1A family [Cognatiyoonia koreensis]